MEKREIFLLFLPPSAAAWASGLSPIRTNGLEEKEMKRLKFLKGKKEKGKRPPRNFFPPTFPYACEKEGGGRRELSDCFRNIQESSVRREKVETELV